jgi:hypothetical protein
MLICPLVNLNECLLSCCAVQDGMCMCIVSSPVVKSELSVAAGRWMRICGCSINFQGQGRRRTSAVANCDAAQ